MQSKRNLKESFTEISPDTLQAFGKQQIIKFLVRNPLSDSL